MASERTDELYKLLLAEDILKSSVRKLPIEI